MKTATILIALFISCAAFGQDDMKDRLNTIEANFVIAKIEASQRMTELENEIKAIKYNLGNYNKQHRTAFLLEGLALGTISIAAAFEGDTESQQVIYITSGIIALTGAVIYIDANKWMKRASIEILPGGVKLKF